MAEKMNQNPDRWIHTDGNNKDNMEFPVYFMMTCNTIWLFVGGYRRNDYSLAVLNLLFFSVVLVNRCLGRYLALPKNEKSSRELWLKLSIWFLYSVLAFGSVHLCFYSFSSQVTAVLYSVVMICSGVLLYAFVIADLVGDWKIRRSQTVDDGK